MKISVVVNPGSGTLCTAGLESIRNTLEQSLNEAGHELTFSGKRGRSKGMLDGELFSSGESLELKTHPESLQVLLPVTRRNSDD
ncbi:hypothetical protein [Granulosicoccus antarcticus]|uniref:DAGKc domain-containing protein n=1 Tax=Granulosicoccus antarcticus IMCC3135 TaxID=1192854 RepID=A0A2Z2NPI8_9GAMM|nr:hypothetical protein [Granulosicoccus antarcticus]ASJ70690.1 hypothetical protein IMCC3135_02885 [Granulosicoccus antarcticus IMCC3135]